MTISRIFLRGFAGFLLMVGSPCHAELFPQVDEVVVLSPSSARFLDAPGAATVVLTAAEIARMQITALPDLLNAISSLTLLEKGSGSQTDISVRGSSNEGVLLLVNGVRVRDPQTGHFLMDIPCDLSRVERVEILSGGGSPQYGSSAVGGIVNIVTRENAGDGGMVSAGSFGSFRARGSVSASSGNAAFTVGAYGGHSDGYTADSDLDYTGADVSGGWNSGQWDVRWNAGVMEKRFGAQGFYASYPSYEEVMTVQAGMNAVRTLNASSLIRLRAGGRGHDDDFALLRSDPDYYRNTHYNRDYTLGGEYVRALGGGSALLGVEAGRIGITSGKLGNHSDAGGAVYGEYTGQYGRSGYSFSLRYDRGYGGEDMISPGIGVDFPLGGGYTVRFRAGESFREPTYTERYYNDPANRGDPDLLAEHSRSMEAGISRNTARSSSGVTVFAARTTNVIDWVRSSGETTWSAVNHARLFTAGAEFSHATGVYRAWRFRGNATILRQWVRGRRGYESKYALNPAEEVLAGVFSGPFSGNFEGAFAFRYERMRSGDVRSPADARVSRRFGGVRMRWSVQNIGNERYEEIPDLPAPGRRYLMEVELAR